MPDEPFDFVLGKARARCVLLNLSLQVAKPAATAAFPWRGTQFVLLLSSRFQPVNINGSLCFGGVATNF